MAGKKTVCGRMELIRKADGRRDQGRKPDEASLAVTMRSGTVAASSWSDCEKLDADSPPLYARSSSFRHITRLNGAFG